MPEPELGIERVKKPFDNYRIEYGITPENKDQTRIEFFSGKVKVGHALFGDGFVGVTGVGPGDEIQLWFPITQFASILSLLETQSKLSLFVDFDPGRPPEIPRHVHRTGIAARGRRKKR
jgi:hypothetical protein